MYHVYMIKNNNDDLYIGVSKDIKNRIKTHNNKSGAEFTKNKDSFRLVFEEKYKSLPEARQREIQLKKWRRDKK